MIYRLTALLLPMLLAACSSAPIQQPTSDATPAPETTEPTRVEHTEHVEPEIAPFPADSFYDLLVAEFAIRRQEYDIALGHYLYQAEVTRDINVMATAARLGQFLNAHKSALAAAEMWLEAEPGNHEARFIAASALAKTNRPLEALPHMAAVLNKGGNTNFAALAASALGQSDAQQQEFLVALQELREDYPEESSLKIAHALLLQYRNREEEALELVQDVLALEADNIHALLIETQILRALDRNEEALARLQFAVEAHPDNKRLRLQLAQLLIKSDLDAARTQFELLGQRYPRDDELTISRAIVEQEAGDLEAAKRLLTPLLLSGDQSDQAHYLLGRIAEREGDRSSALAHYRQVNPGTEFLRAVSRITQILQQHDGLDAARETLAVLRDRHPTQAVRLYLLESELLFDARAYQTGHDLLTRALQQHPKDPGVLYSRSLFSERIRNLPLLEQDLRLLLEMEPDNPAALNALGYSLANLTDRLDEARDLVERALVFRPDDPAIQDSLGWILYLQGDLQGALKLLASAFEQINDHEIAAHYGEVLWQLGQREQALAVWQQGFEDEPDSHIINETMQRLGATRD